MTTGRQDSLGSDEWGIQPSWLDSMDARHAVSGETIGTLRHVIGRPPADLEMRAPLVTRRGRRLGTGPVDIACEDGETRHVDGVLPDDFPLGYHQLRREDGAEQRLIVSPGRCWLPQGWRAWGWTVQLYAARSRASWGIGDIADLGTLREWAQTLGAGFLLVNPLHAVAPTLPQEASPYLPVSRRYRNPLYLRVEDVPGADRVDLTSLASRGHRLNRDRLIDRDAVWTLKREALWQLYVVRDDADGFATWREQQGRSLEEFATWSALAEEYGPDWRTWKMDLRRPDGDAVARFARQHRARVTFHAWLQWLLDQQLHAASADLTVIQDLPIGVDGGGADAWAWQDQLAGGVSVGAPPDAFNSSGQDWGTPPLIPWRLRADGYQAFIDSIRATMAGAGGLRIDHVMGLFRLWWIPAGGSVAEGAYVRYPSEDLLDIVALESHRAQAIVVGEDLGTVEDGVRAAMAEHGVLSYRLLWFEDQDPADWPVDAMAAVTTHDLPTVAGLWSGADLTEQRQLGRGTEQELASGRRTLLSRLREPAGLNEAATVEEVVEGAHRLLARAPSTLVSATLEDAVAEERRPNMPGASARSNWCLALTVPVEDLPSHETVLMLAEVLRTGVAGPGPARRSSRSAQGHECGGDGGDALTPAGQS